MVGVRLELGLVGLFVVVSSFDSNAPPVHLTDCDDVVGGAERLRWAQMMQHHSLRWYCRGSVLKTCGKKLPRQSCAVLGAFCDGPPCADGDDAWRALRQHLVGEWTCLKSLADGKIRRSIEWVGSRREDFV